MAYPDQPYGFIPLRHKSGAPYNGASRPYWIDASDSPGDGQYFIGDPVIHDGTSNTSALSFISIAESQILSINKTHRLNVSDMTRTQTVTSNTGGWLDTS